MSGQKTEASARKGEANQVSTIQGVSTEQKHMHNAGDPDCPGLKSNFRDPSTMDGKLRWD